MILSKNDKIIIVKLSGASLKCNKDNNSIFNHDFVVNIGKNFKKLVEIYMIKIVLIIGGGNIWRGVNDKQIHSDKSDYMGMISTMINGIYIKEMLIKNNLKCKLVSELAINNVIDKFNKSKYINSLDEKKPDVLICCAGTGKPSVSTDTAASVKGEELKINKIFFAKNNVDGIYNKDPNIYINSKYIAKLSYDEAINMNIHVIDKNALYISKRNNHKLYFFNFNCASNILKLLDNKLKYSIIE